MGMSVTYRSLYNTSSNIQIPLHRSFHKQSSDWLVENRSIGHQNVPYKITIVN